MGQSLVFYVPEEVRRKICEVLKLPGEAPITKVDLLSWSIWETWQELQRCSHLWAVEGMRHQRQKEIMRLGAKPGKEFKMTKGIAVRYLDDEAQPLKTRYSPRKELARSLLGDDFHALAKTNPHVRRINARYMELGALDASTMTLNEEQERELAPEMEAENETYRPPPRKPRIPLTVHPDVEQFVITGRIVPGSEAFKPAFMAFEDSSAAQHIVLSEFPDDLLVTEEFVQTVQPGHSYVSDDFQRPVQWVVTARAVSSDLRGGRVEQMVVFSPWEVNELLPLISEHAAVTLHMYSARPNPTFRSLEDLTLFTTPSLPEAWTLPDRLRMLLNLFSGQLCLRSYSDYVQLRDFLRQANVDGDGSVQNLPEDNRGGFSTNPLPFVGILMTKLRRDSPDIRRTDLGRLITGQILDETYFSDRSEPQQLSRKAFQASVSTESELPYEQIPRDDEMKRIPRSMSEVYSTASASRPEDKQGFDKLPKNVQEHIARDLATNPGFHEETDLEESGDDEWEHDSFNVSDEGEYNHLSTYLRHYSYEQLCRTCGCSLCHREPTDYSDSLERRWLIVLSELEQSAKTCSPCDMLWQAVLFARPHFKVAAHSIELEYSWKTRQLLLWHLDGEGHRDWSAACEFYRCGEHTKCKICPFQLVYLQRRVVRLLTFYFSAPWIGVPWRPHVKGVTDLPAAVAWTQKQISKCERHHRCFIPPEDHFPLPRRVLDLGDPETVAFESGIRLWETENEHGTYAAVSHCWGKTPHLCTTKRTLEKFKLNIPWEEISATYRDSIKIARSLGVRYLWIDSLCIVQDDTDDWRREAAKMAEIYQRSWVTVAATSALDGNSGILPTTLSLANGHKLIPRKRPLPRRGKRRKAMQGMKPLDIGPVFVRRQPQHDPYSQTSHTHGPPLLTRAWVYQERVLSPRVMHYGADELVWECEETFVCECGAVQHDTLGGATVKQGHQPTLAGGKWTMSSSLSAGSKIHIDDIARLKKHPLLKQARFRGAVGEYGQLNLTFAKDRLPAIAGVARQFQEPTRGRYLAGLWEGTLAQDLQWEATTLVVPSTASRSIGDISADWLRYVDNGMEATHPDIGAHRLRIFGNLPQSMTQKARARPPPGKRPEPGHDDFIAPSWSWASVQRARYNLATLQTDEPPKFTFVAGEIRAKGADEFGECEAGFLVLAGQLMAVRLQLMTSAGKDKDDPEQTWEAIPIFPNAHVAVDFQFDRACFNTRRWQAEQDAESAAPLAIGDSFKLYYIFPLTASAALLLERVSTGAGVYRRVGIVSEYEYQHFSSLPRRTIKLI